MTDESPGNRGDAAWKEQRESIARRNADVQKRAQRERTSRAGVVAAAARVGAELEAKQLRELNARIEKRRGRGAR